MQNNSLGNNKPKSAHPKQTKRSSGLLQDGLACLVQLSGALSRYWLPGERFPLPLAAFMPYLQAETRCFGCGGCRVANPGSARDGGAEAAAQRVHPVLFHLFGPCCPLPGFPFTPSSCFGGTSAPSIQSPRGRVSPGPALAITQLV